MHREGTSTPHARHKGQKPLIECAQRDFRIVYFSLFYVFLCFYAFYVFYILYFFGVDKGVVLTPTYPQVR